MIENDDKKASDKISSVLVYFTDSECKNKSACNFSADESWDAGASQICGKKLLVKFYTSLYKYYTLIYTYFTINHLFASAKLRTSVNLLIRRAGNLFGEPPYNILLSS